MSAGDAGGSGAAASERERIVRAFVELVTERGYEEVDLSMVGACAGVDIEAVHRHFADRFGCFVAAWDDLEEAYIRQMVRACESGGGWREQLRAAAWQTTRLVEESPAEARFLIVESLGAGSEGQMRQERLTKNLASLLDRALGNKSQSDGGSSLAARWVVGVFFHYLYSCLTSGRDGEVGEEVPQLMFLAVSAFAGPEEGLAELEVPPP